MIITKENKYVYYSTVKKWIESCETIEQLNNVFRFINKMKNQEYRFHLSSIKYDLISIMLNKRDNILDNK